MGKSLKILTQTRPQQVYDRLRKMLDSEELSVGQRMTPMKKLAEIFGTSVPTVKRALDRLEAEGMVRKRHGSGTFVASPHPPLSMSNTVGLCIESSSDVWGELAALLLWQLHSDGRTTTLFDTSHPQADALLTQAWYSDMQCMIVHATRFVSETRLENLADSGKQLFGVVDWQLPPDVPFAARVLSDYRHGCELVCRHLRELGHQHILIIGTEMQIYFLRYPEMDLSTSLPRTMREIWEAEGGTWQALNSESVADTRDTLDADNFLRILDEPDAPTAIVGLRDVEASLAQRILSQQRPDLARNMAIVGYFDTPWSVAGHPPITSVNLNLEEIARRTMEVIDDSLAGKLTDGHTEYIAPKLVVRKTSRPRQP